MKIYNEASMVRLGKFYKKHPNVFIHLFQFLFSGPVLTLAGIALTNALGENRQFFSQIMSL